MIRTSSSRIALPKRWLSTAVIALLVWGALCGTALADDAPPVRDFTLGASVQGRPITAVRFGDGSHKFVLVGATHGAPERNTYELSEQLIDYFRAHPSEVPRNVSMYIVPVLNPDGLAINSRWNARDVDLNRNMDTSDDTCPENDWRHTVNGAYGVVSDSGGPYPESEPESRLIRDFLLDADGVIFFHSNAGVVFPACAHEPSRALAQAFAAAANYDFIPVWDRYVITGGMHDWAGGMGIPAITPELVTGELTEFDQNLAGVQAVLAGADTLLVEPQVHEENGVAVQPVIWRAWRAWGGKQVWGDPLAPPTQTADGWEQLFANARFQYRPAQSDSRFVVQVSAVDGQRGAGAVQQVAADRNAVVNPDLATPQTDTLFAQWWEQHGGAPMFGGPVAAPQETQVNGQRVVRETFRRVIMERPVDAAQPDQVRLVPLGHMLWAQQDAASQQTCWRAR